MKTKSVFLTGSTGLVGSYLLKVLLQENYKVYALSRSNNTKSAKDRVFETLNFWDKSLLKKKADNLIVLEGDITEKNFGFNKKTIDLLTGDIEEIFHSAAVTRFNWPLKEIRKVNVKGTKTVLDFAVKCSKQTSFRKVNHISTAYICGDHKGLFKENDLDVGQSFNSTYEQSKFEAEKLIENYRKQGLWVDIFRPPLVIGEYKTGKTITFNQSVYQLLHMWNLELFDMFPGKDYAVLMVFVDDLCKAILNLSNLNQNRNKNYHVFNSELIPLQSLLDIASSFLRIKKPKLVTHDCFLKNNPSPAQKLLLKNNILAYNCNVKLDSSKSIIRLRKNGFNFFSFDKLSFFNTLTYCVSSGFLK